MLDPNLARFDLHPGDLPHLLAEAARLIEASYLRLSSWLAGHLPRIGTLIAAAGLSLYGRYLNEAVRRLALRWPFPLRVGAFIVVVGFCFGALLATIAPLLTAGLRTVATPYLVPAVLTAFIVVGILAERSGRI